MRVVPRPNEAINETWIADRDRFSYEGIYSDDRLRAPHDARRAARGRRVDWEAALEAAATSCGTRSRTAARALGVARVAGLHASKNAILLARLARGARLATTSIIACASAISATRRTIRRIRRSAVASRDIDALAGAAASSAANLRMEAPIARAPRAQGGARAAQRSRSLDPRARRICSRSRLPRSRNASRLPAAPRGGTCRRSHGAPCIDCSASPARSRSCASRDCARSADAARDRAGRARACAIRAFADLRALAAALAERPAPRSATCRKAATPSAPSPARAASRRGRKGCCRTGIGCRDACWSRRSPGLHAARRHRARERHRSSRALERRLPPAERVVALTPYADRRHEGCARDAADRHVRRNFRHAT